jgi:hypothetical protein
LWSRHPPDAAQGSEIGAGRGVGVDHGAGPAGTVVRRVPHDLVSIPVLSRDRAVEVDDATAVLDDGDRIGPDTAPRYAGGAGAARLVGSHLPAGAGNEHGRGLMAELLCAGVLGVDEYDVLDPALPIVERAVDFRR